MKKLAVIMSLFLTVAASPAKGDRSIVSPEVHRELSSFGPYGAFPSILEGIVSDERIIMLKTPIGSFRIPTSDIVYTYFGPLRPPSAGFSAP